MFDLTYQPSKEKTLSVLDGFKKTTFKGGFLQSEEFFFIHRDFL
jgi:hypothetical protein